MHVFDAVVLLAQCPAHLLNAAALLRLSQIEPFAAERDDAAPLIVAAGEGIVNWEPIAAFVDVVLLGDPDESLPAALEAASVGGARDGRLARIARVPWRLHAVVLHDLGRGRDSALHRARRAAGASPPPLRPSAVRRAAGRPAHRDRPRWRPRRPHTLRHRRGGGPGGVGARGGLRLPTGPAPRTAPARLRLLRRDGRLPPARRPVKRSAPPPAAVWTPASPRRSTPARSMSSPLRRRRPFAPDGRASPSPPSWANPTRPA